MNFNARFDDWVRAILSVMVVGGFVYVIIYGQMTGRSIPDSEFTVYVGAVTLALGWYLGSSYGSNAKERAKEQQ